MEFEVVWGENLELENGVNGRVKEEEEAEQQRERRERELVGREQVREKGGTCANYQVAPPYSLLFIWSKLNRFCYR